MLVIGLTGTKSSGKGEIAEYLRKNGFIYFSLSNIVREEAVKRGITNYNIKDLQDVGNDLRKKQGTGILAKMTAEKILEEINKGNDKFVIDGIRNPGEVEELRKLENFHLKSIDAPQNYRFEWLLKRARLSDPKTWEEFLKMDIRDRGNGELKIGQQVYQCMEMADFHIINDSTIEKLLEKAEEILKKLSNP